jgi:hypothetical protein
MYPQAFTSVFELTPFRKIGITERVIRILFPLTLGVTYLILLLVALPYQQWLMIGGLMLAYIIPFIPTGKESVIPIGIAVGFPWWLMVITIAFLDILGGIFVALNFDTALKIPYFGRWLPKFIVTGEQFFERRPWLGRFSCAGVALFVMLPFQGSGRATILGRMMGLSPIPVLLAVSIGAFAGCTIIALGAVTFEKLILMYPILGFFVVVTVIAGLVILYGWYRGKIRKSDVE